MDNYQIADALSLLSKLTDIHGENSFKSKSYSAAAFAIEKCGIQLSETPIEKISSIKGIGSSTAQKVIELLETGKLRALEEIITKTPPGIIEMLNIKGIGPKKINTIWKEMQIESVGELLYACKENRLKLYKGFGEKTQQAVIDTIEFYLRNKQSHLFVQLELIAPQMKSILEEIFGKIVYLAGEFARELEVINHLDYVIGTDRQTIIAGLQNIPGFKLKQEDDILTYETSTGLDIRIIPSNPAETGNMLVQHNSSPDFYEVLAKMTGFDKARGKNEEEFFNSLGINYIPPVFREKPATAFLKEELPPVIEFSDIKGIIHCHSTWSDGTHTLEQLALAAKSMGMEYLVITDHSRSAFYANGLTEDRIKAQHEQIDELNEKLKPFRIFKGIESDILNDGSLDYPDSILASFDLVVASVHSNFRMSIEKATERIVTAVRNPFTTVMGHLTGRLLLSRNGYPVNHDEVIEACALENVVLELNANPSRLDVDWRHIPKATEQGVMISIDPDAHFIDGLNDIRYGVMVARKALLNPAGNLSSMPLEKFNTFLRNRKQLKGI